ncbi:hypothetical protein EJ08DRAFT_677666, partial [Tothia fuscella]
RSSAHRPLPSQQSHLSFLTSTSFVSQLFFLYGCVITLQWAASLCWAQRGYCLLEHLDNYKL